MKKYIILAILIGLLITLSFSSLGNDNSFRVEYQLISLQASSDKVSLLVDDANSDWIELSYANIANRKCKIRKIQGTDIMEYQEGEDVYTLYKLSQESISKNLCLDLAPMYGLRATERILRTVKCNEVSLGSYIFEKQITANSNEILFEYGQTSYTDILRYAIENKYLDNYCDVYAFSKAIALNKIICDQYPIGLVMAYNKDEKTFSPILTLGSKGQPFVESFSNSYYGLTIQNAIVFFHKGTGLANEVSKKLAQYKLSNKDSNRITKDIKFAPNREAAYGLLISEVMPANRTYREDIYGRKPDWIELFNMSDRTINLEGYKLRDNVSGAEWTFPDVSIYANSYFTVWCSDSESKGTEHLYTGFSLKSGYGNIELIDPQGRTIDYCIYKNVPDDMTFGVIQSDVKKGLLVQPTYGISNDTLLRNPVETLAEPIFSAEAGFYDEAFLLELSSEDPEVRIYYTTDGSEPTINSHLYKQPIEIKNRDSEPMAYANHVYSLINSHIPSNEHVPKCTVIRAIAVKEGLVSRIATKSYFVGESAIDKNLPIVSLAVNPDEFFSEEKGIYAVGEEGWKWREENPDNRDRLTILQLNTNYGRKGIESEVGASIEIFDPINRFYDQTNIGVRVRGTYSRLFNKKSLTLKAKNIYDKKDLNFSFGGQQRQKDLYLRNSGQAITESMFTDALVHQLAKDLGLDYQDYRTCIAFINGEYWGLYNLRDVIDEDYFMEKYHVTYNDICIYDGVESFHIFVEGNSKIEDKYAKLLQLVQGDYCDDETYKNISDLLDIENFTKYVILNELVGNTDWPRFNVRMYWGNDIKIRYIIYDNDLCSLKPRDLLNAPIDNDTLSGVYILYKYMMTNRNYNEYFTQTKEAVKMLLSKEYVVNKIQQMASDMEKEVQNDILRWNNIRSVDIWNNAVNRMIENVMNEW